MSEAEGVAAAPPAERIWPHVVKLRKPVDFAGEAIASLTFQCGIARYLKGMRTDGLPGFDTLLLLASRMCGQPIAALELLGPEDTAEVTGIAFDFFVRCHPGGWTP